MNTINDMAQLIMACDFDHRHYMEFPQENYPNRYCYLKIIHQSIARLAWF